MATWFTSDLHLGHLLVARSRGCETPGEHDAALTERWRGLVAAEDEVFVLGDVALGGWRDNIPRVADLPGVKHLVLGNHDRAHPMHNRAHAYIHEYETVFASVQTAATVKIAGTRLVLSHFPYDGDHTVEDRTQQWRLRDLGVPILHGHTHSTEVVSRSDSGTLQIHVGLDAWQYRPVSERELSAVLAEHDVPRMSE